MALRLGYLTLIIIGNVIDCEDLSVERVWIDKDGDEYSECILPEYFDDKHPCRIYWDYQSGLHDDDLFDIVAPIIGSFEIVPSGNVSPLSTIPLTVIVSAITGMLPFKRFCGSCTVSLVPNSASLLGDVVFVGAMPKREENHYLDLNVTDEKGNVIDCEDLSVERGAELLLQVTHLGLAFGTCAEAVASVTTLRCH